MQIRQRCLDTSHILVADHKRSTLEFAYVESPVTLQDVIEAHDPAAVDRFTEAGRILRIVHDSDPTDELAATNDRPTTADMLVSGMRALPTSTFANSSGGELDYWRVLQSDQLLATALSNWSARLRTGRRTPIHGDLRPDQFLLDESHRVLLIDGEEVAVGSPILDLAGMLGSIIFAQLLTALADIQDAARGRTPIEGHNAFMAAADRRLLECVPIVSALLEGYGGLDYLDDAPLLAQGIGCTMLERIMARSMFSFRISATDKVIAGIGRQALLTPEALDFIFDDRRVA